MDNSQLSQFLEEFGLFLELDGANPFKIRAINNASEIIANLSDSAQELLKEGKLTDIKGIGQGIADHLQEYVSKGKCKELETIKKKYPKNILDILHIPGVGAKKTAVLWKKLKVKDIPTLKRACEQNKVAKLAGFGEKTQKKILEGIQFLDKTGQSHLVSMAMDEAEKIIRKIKSLKEVKKCEVAGSLRRAKEVIGDIDVLVTSSKPKKVMDTFVKLPQVETILGHGDKKSSVQLESGIQVDMRVMNEKEYPFALMYFTGSKEHSTVLRGLAKDKGYKLNEYGLFKNDRLVPCRSEADIYKKLGLEYIPPELRENQIEFELAKKKRIPKLVELKDIKGVFHVHSTWSDGHNSLEQMIQAALEAGYDYVGLSDHSKAAAYANGLKPDRVKQQHKEIDKLQKKYKKIRLFKGTECDILKDGSMDYSESVLKSFDFVIASVHSSFTLDKKTMTNRVIKALKNPYVTMLGHSTGRLLLARDEFQIDLKQVIQAAADYGKMIEINANPHRLDLDWRLLPYAKKCGMKVSINPDAHSTEGLLDTKYGVGIARKGGLEKKDVFNTLTTTQVEKAFSK